MASAGGNVSEIYMKSSHITNIKNAYTYSEGESCNHIGYVCERSNKIRQNINNFSQKYDSCSSSCIFPASIPLSYMAGNSHDPSQVRDWSLNGMTLAGS